MNRKIRVLFLLTLCLSSFSYSHKEPTHQYLVREAYKLLKANLGGSVDILDAYMGDTQGRYSPGPIDYAYVVSGAWNEDHHDIVYKHGKPVDPLGLWNLAMVSITHFWKVNGSDLHASDNNVTNLDPLPITAENAWQKIKAYRDGGWEFYYWENGTNYGTVYSYPNGLIDVFKTGKIYKVKTVNTLGQSFPVNKWVTLTTSFRRRLVFNILGRMAHLLGDMSVPAHAHSDEHGTLPDKYENAMNVEGDYPSYATYWNASNCGSYINPYATNDDPLHYLMYTTNQIADHFASNRVDGNEDFAPIGSILQIMEDVYPPTSKYDYANLSSNPSAAPYWLTNIRDCTIPYTIRATAGLLYWFKTEAGLGIIPPPQPPGILSTNSAYLYAGVVGEYFSGSFPVSNIANIGSKNLYAYINPPDVIEPMEPLPSNYVTVDPSYSNQGIAVAPGQTINIPFWGNRPTESEITYWPPDGYATFYRYAEVAAGEAGYQKITFSGLVSRFIPDPCGGGEDEPLLANYNSPEIEMYNSKFKQYEKEVKTLTSEWERKQTAFYKTIIEENIDVSLGKEALMAWLEYAFLPSTPSKDREVFINTLRELSVGDVKKIVPAFAGLILADMEGNRELKLSRMDNIIKNHGSDYIAETALLNKFRYLLSLNDIVEAREVSKEIDIVFGNSLASYDAHLRLGDRGYTESEFKGLLNNQIELNKVRTVLPEKIELYTNFPNPFNPTTTISYSLPKETQVILSVYNALGQLVKTLVSDLQTAGYYSVKWDGTNTSGAKVTSGTYLYRLETGKSVITQKMVLLK